MQRLLILGLGLIGKQRLTAALEFGLAAEDIGAFDPRGASELVSTYPGLSQFDTLETALANNPEGIVISTPHNVAMEILSKADLRNSSILLEKPLGRNIEEANTIATLAKSKNLDISLGFNYRHMPGVVELRNILDSNVLGKLHNIKIDFGHGGAPGDEKSWKLDPIAAGGGVLLDPGVHIFDLLLHLLGAKSKDFEYSNFDPNHPVN